MKKSNSTIRSLLLAIGFCLISFNGQSQDVRLTGQDRRDARNAEMYINYRIIDSLLTSQRFVLTADYLENRYGDRAFVQPMLNFIRVDSSQAVIQTGSSTNFGYNGVGGVTAEGHINSYKIVRDTKTLSFYVQFSVITTIGIYDVAMNISSDNNVRATITGLTPGNLIYTGHLENGANSRVYKGQVL